jgi:hypothetical protein
MSNSRKPCLGVILWFAGLVLLTGCGSAGHEASSPPKAAPAEAKTIAAAPAAVAPPAPAAPVAPPIEAPVTNAILKEAAAKPSEPFEGEGWREMFDRTLKGWKVTDFAGGGRVECEDGLLVLNMGDPFTGVNWSNDFPRMNYEVALDAMRWMGSDFFCGLTVPVGDSFCSLIVGGWGGSLVGISSLDGMDASENETTKFVNFESKRWYRIRLRVTPGRIEVWIDNDKLINVNTTDRKISLRPGEIELSKPMGIASWQTSAALRQIKYRPVSGPAGPAPKF